MKLIGVVQQAELRNKANPFWQIQLKTETDSIKIVFWDQSNETSHLPQKDEFWQIDLSAEHVRDQRSSKYNNIIATASACTKLKQEEVPKSLLEKIVSAGKVDAEILKRSFRAITDQTIYKDIKVFKLVMACFASIPKEAVQSCPAGTSVHHSKQGGLLQHLAEVLEIAQGTVSRFPYSNLIDTDLVYAGASLHDIGKFQHYGIDNNGAAIMSNREVTIGHIYASMALVERIGREQGIDSSFLDELLHVIASHHQRPEFGAVKEPQSLEAIIVAQSDYLSAKAGVVDSSFENSVKNNKGFKAKEFFETRTIAARLSESK